MSSEPTTDEAIAAWINDHVAGADMFASVAAATAAHRAEHGCDAFEGGNGPMLGALATATKPSRLLEVGTALGYGALWLARGGGPTCAVDTVDLDPTHAELAREQFDRFGVTNIAVHVGNDLDVLATLAPGYDVIFYDANVPTPAHMEHFDHLLATRGLLISSNLFLGRYAPDLPGLVEGAQYREALFGPGWLTAFANSKALSVHAPVGP